MKNNMLDEEWFKGLSVREQWIFTQFYTALDATPGPKKPDWAFDLVNLVRESADRFFPVKKPKKSSTT